MPHQFGGRGLLWLESPTNPLLAVADLEALIAGAHQLGMDVAVDNTFATPLLQRPLDFGADVVVHSATKLLAGHSDVVLGAAVTRRPEVVGGLLAPAARCTAPSPVRGRRGWRSGESGRWRCAWIGPRPTPAELARRLSEPRRRSKSFAIRGCRSIPVTTSPPGRCADSAPWWPSTWSAAPRPRRRSWPRVRLATAGTSLGGVETLIERRGRWAGEGRLPPGLLRLSVGIEDVEDLWRDLDAALRSAPG